ncbi:MAG: arylsulfatase, partial [Planctomycetota bacterium]
REHVHYYRGTQLMAIRWGPWKAHYYTQDAYGAGARLRMGQDPPLLFHLGHDPAEKYNVNADHPDVLETIDAIAEAHRKNLDAPPSQLEIPLPTDP